MPRRNVFIPDSIDKIITGLTSKKNELTEDRLISGIIQKAGDLTPPPCQKRGYARRSINLDQTAQEIARRIDDDLTPLKRYDTTFALAIGTASLKAYCQAKTGRTNRIDVLNFLGGLEHE